jgi:beta-phosphoglucomutase-like phosphatase (HAD superfamily)
MPQAIIFDIDGTLIDTVDLHAQAWVDTFRHYGREVSSRRYAGRSARAATSSCRYSWSRM